MNNKNISIVVALDQGAGFAKDGKIPWLSMEYTREDLKNFKELTNGGICVFGRNTYTEINDIKAAKGLDLTEPILKGRTSYVVSKTEDFNPSGATKVGSLTEVLSKYQDDATPIFILGGEKLFIEGLSWCSSVHLTVVKDFFNCDKQFPVEYLTRNFKIESGKDTEHLYFVKYVRTQ